MVESQGPRAWKENHQVISPTAYLTAYWGALSDAPYVKEIARRLDAESVSRWLVEELLEPLSWYGGALVESRNEAVKREVERLGCKNIYGLAEGALPTGMTMTADPEVKYMHTDLPVMLSKSEAILRDMMVGDGLRRENLRFSAVDVLDKKQMEEGAAYFNGRPFVITNKGLLVYFDLRGKDKIVQNISEVLMENNGLAWITSDIHFKDSPVTFEGVFGKEYAEIIKEARERVAVKTNGIGIGANFFDNEPQAHELFDRNNLAYERRPIYDGSFSLSVLRNMPENLRQGMIDFFSGRWIYVLSPKR